MIIFSKAVVIIYTLQMNSLMIRMKYKLISRNISTPFQEGWLTTVFCYCYDSCCFDRPSSSFFSSSHSVNIYDEYKQTVLGNCKIQMPCLGIYFQCLPLRFVPSLATLLAVLMEQRGLSGLADRTTLFPCFSVTHSQFSGWHIYLNSHIQDNNFCW